MLRITLLAFVASTALAAEPIKINGWYSCNAKTFATPVPDTSVTADLPAFSTSAFSADTNVLRSVLRPIDATSIQSLAFASTSASSATTECAEFTLPLCYEGACNTAGSIPVFVKRMRATKRTSSTKALWFLQGGPGASSVAMESLMTLLYSMLNGAVDVYTMDHRGTGRSYKLTCSASQIETSGSPTKGQVLNSVLSTCIKDINIQIGANDTKALRSFSTTSAAMDLSTLISATENANTFVYGVSYGTYLVERLMQLENANIKGYILDGIVANSGSKENKLTVFNDWDKEVDEAAQTFVDLCKTDTYCSSKFPTLDLRTTMVTMYSTMDRNPKSSKCAMALSSSSSTPSAVLRSLFSDLLQSQSLRALIPALVYRFNRCNQADILAIANFATQVQNMGNTQDESDGFESTMLYNLIVVSELWRTPTESYDTLKQTFTNTLIGSNIASLVTTYCIASGGSDPNCINERSPSNSYKWQYPRDTYYDVPITIPKGTSVLLLSGLLDPQTTARGARNQYDSFIGSAKRLVEFNYSAHGTIVNTPVTKLGGAPCAAQLVGSFVTVDGDVTALDTSCLAAVAPMSFQIKSSLAQTLMATSDIYDGTPTKQYKPSSTAPPADKVSDGSATTATDDASAGVSSGYRTAAIVGFVLAALLAIGMVIVVRRQRKQAAATTSIYVEPIEHSSAP
ncbi:hypothetical protein SDRG_03946 [Saprolegnia diclina VS20]|uniref:AB hydrolase-1 domain-containing protein n=1 Tax=Saprolegnia diclina (strain VS20) TaxID=1156394 RepID=T0S275_SAPDV|nr:hypothetical protein SDRG_03946 [Saprolegnia diclina VS20]EQC38993.1 hypothetical protein SDRG_03946 [Saprolegnia diclina VS20]|eukprot:XP_008607817.1 hypothetical protein SDRG_03946 [Saprolegnia diclina VS20]